LITNWTLRAYISGQTFVADGTFVTNQTLKTLNTLISNWAFIAY